MNVVVPAQVLVAEPVAAPMKRTAVLVVIAAWLSIGAATAVAAPAEKQGYIPMADGTQLEYTVNLPDDTGAFPVAMVYDGYCEGPGGTRCNEPTHGPALLAAGYAVLGVSIRGTSCSTGTFDAFSSQEWRDGAAAVEWAARQSWSNGHIGMFGDSFPGITQVGVAGLRPPHLDAIAPFQVVTDVYRDAGYPGGIQNTGFGAFWAGVDQPNNSYRSGIQQAVNAGDAGCAQAQVTHAASEPTQNLGLQALRHPFHDAYWQDRMPGANAARIDIPTFGCVSWQDDETSSRGAAYLSELDPRRTWVVGTNGYHAQCALHAPRITAELIAFFDRFVKGASNGFERTPHIQLWHEATTDTAGNDVPGWVTGFASYASMPVRPLALYFRPGGALSLTRPKASSAPDRYAYPGPSVGNEDGVIFGQNDLLWKAPEPPGASLAYTTPRLARDTEFFGSGSANLWLSSTAPDTDLQITLTEVRPDGQEVYIVRGWLRASHRALDRKRSTTLAPFHTDQESDARQLAPGTPTLMRVQLWPFDHVFRKGSSLRLWIGAPTGETGGWSLDFLKTPAINSISTDARHPSAIVLGQLAGGRAEKPLPACDTLLNQPCRRNGAAVPPGTMTISARRASGAGSAGRGS
jgi:putative CocE/NonD family hydrolase